MNDLHLTNSECYYPVTYPLVTPTPSIRRGRYWRTIVLTKVQNLILSGPLRNPGSQGPEAAETPRGVDHPAGAATMATPAPSTQPPEPKPPTPRKSKRRKATTK